MDKYSKKSFENVLKKYGFRRSGYRSGYTQWYSDNKLNCFIEILNDKNNYWCIAYPSEKVIHDADQLENHIKGLKNNG